MATWLRTSIAFARAHDAVQAGVAVLGVPTSRALAAADMPDLVGHWSRKAREAEKDRDQATFGRLLGEVAGAVGQGAQVAVQTNVTLHVQAHRRNDIVTVDAEQPGPERRDVTDAERTDDEERQEG